MRYCLSFILIGLVAMAPTLQAQMGVYTTITGEVQDAKTGNPLPNANVFLANTTLGAVTNTEGIYSIKAPLGTHVVVCSLIGYAVQKHSQRIVEPREVKVNFALQESELRVGEVEVVAETPHEWKKHLKKFETLFWGEDYKASACKILNPEVLDFAVDEEERLFYAESNRPIQIENRLLGYRADILMDDFRYDLDKDEIRYWFTPRFEALTPADATEEERWRENRRRAYLGSLQHFIVALTSEKVFDEGFELFSLAGLPWENQSTNIIWGEKSEKRPINDASQLFVPAESPVERNLQFEDVLEVRFTRGSKEQISWMVLQRDFVTVNTAGYLSDAYGFMVYGYWFDQRFAKALPRDYVPE